MTEEACEEFLFGKCGMMHLPATKLGLYYH